MNVKGTATMLAAILGDPFLQGPPAVIQLPDSIDEGGVLQKETEDFPDSAGLGLVHKKASAVGMPVVAENNAASRELAFPTACGELVGGSLSDRFSFKFRERQQHGAVHATCRSRSVKLFADAYQGNSPSIKLVS
jgi:hypothetical protein